jgi:hypothetical protein
MEVGSIEIAVLMITLASTVKVFLMKQANVHCHASSGNEITIIYCAMQIII